MTMKITGGVVLLFVLIPFSLHEEYKERIGAVPRLTNKYIEANDRLSELETEIEYLKLEIVQIKEEQKNRVGKRPGAVKFEIRQTSTMYPNNDEYLKFNELIFNEGDAYDKDTGLFTAPMDGTYMFWAIVMTSWDGRDFRVALMIDGEEQLRGYTGQNLRYGTANIIYIKEFKKGQKVGLMIVNSSSIKVHGNRFTNFGGTLLNAN